MARSAVKTRNEVKKLVGNTRNLLDDLRMSRREAVNQLRKELAQSRSGVKSDVRQMLRRFQKARQNSVVELNKVKAAHQKSATGSQVCGRAAKTPLKTEAPAAKEEIPDLETKVLAAVNEHPEGLNLAGVAEGLGVAPIVLGKVSKSLLDKGEVRKEGKLYFPVDGEKEAGQGLHFRPPLR